MSCGVMVIVVELAALKTYKQRTTDTGDAAAAAASVEWTSDSVSQAGLLQRSAPYVVRTSYYNHRLLTG